MKKKNVLVLFLLTFVVLCLNAQTKIDTCGKCSQYRLIEEAKNKSDKIKDFAPLQQLLDSNKITFPDWYSTIYIYKADFLREKNKIEIESYKQGGTIRGKIIDEILSCYQIAIDSCKKNKLEYQQQRCEFLRTIDDTDLLLYENDSLDLIQAGYYSKNYNGLSTGINYIYGKDNWLGLEISLLEYYQPPKSFKNAEGELMEHYVGVAFHLISFAYTQNLNKNVKDFSLSLFQFTAPVFINITKIGFQKFSFENKKQWYYRPEIGIAWRMISLGYSYNFMFSKDLRGITERHLINLKIIYPLIKYKTIIDI